MNHVRAALPLLILLCLPALSPAADLSRIDRTIKKEPAYKGQPRYCLLAFGPEARTRVWVVVDGDVLYVDRNGDGDLTNPGERLPAREVYRRPKERPDVEVMRTFELECWKDGAKPILTCGPEAQWFYVHEFIPRKDYRDQKEVKYWQERPFDIAVTTKTGQCQRAALRFGGSPQEAPILHLDGPRRFRASDKFGPSLFRRGTTCELYTELYAPGLKATVRTEIYEVPKEVHPVADIAFPPGQPNGKPIRLSVKLKQRC
jgi:hypothetical protein